MDDGLLDDTDLAISNGGGGMSSFTGSDGEFVGVGDHLFVFFDVLGELVQLPDDCGSLSFSNTNFKDRFGNHLSLAETILDSSSDGITEDTVAALHGFAVASLFGKLSFSSVVDGTLASANTGLTSLVFTSTLSFNHNSVRWVNHYPWYRDSSFTGSQCRCHSSGVHSFHGSNLSFSSLHLSSLSSGKRSSGTGEVNSVGLGLLGG